jgi:site-specific recombinase
MALSKANLPHFFEGVFASLNYWISLTVIAAAGGALAAKQPAVIAPALASKMNGLNTSEGLQGLMSEIAVFIRAQTAAVLGNVLTLTPVMLMLAIGVQWWSGTPFLHPGMAHANLDALSILSWSPAYAVLTGVLLWVASLMACFADNWFALRRLRDSLMHHRRLVHALGAARAERWSFWLECNLARIVGNICLALLLGMTPVWARFFGLDFEIRHMTFALGTLAASAGSLGLPILETREFWFALGGIVAIGFANIGVAFLCSLVLALRTCDVPARMRRLVFKTMLKRLFTQPGFFLWAAGNEVETLPATRVPLTELPERKRMKNRP